MPRRATRPGPPTLLLGVWGQGETSQENVDALLDDFIDGAGKVTPKFLIPLTKDDTSDGVLNVFDYALGKGYEVTVVYTKKPQSKDLKDYLAQATNEHVALDPVTDDDRFESTENAVADHFAQLLSKDPDDARLLFLWAEEDGEPDEDDQRVLAAVADCGVQALDLTQGLEALDVDPPAEGGDGEPAGDDNAEPAGDDDKGGEDEPDFETVQAWPIRRIRSYAKKIAQQDREDNVEDVPSDEDLDDSDKYNKDALLDYLFPEDDGGKKDPEPEPEPPKKQTSGRRPRTPAKDEGDEKGITHERAREMREESEKDGTDSTSKNRRKAAASKPEKPADEPAGDGEGEDTWEPSSALLQAVTDLMPDLSPSDNEDVVVAGALKTLMEEFADTIIDRIAARVEKEPEGSDIRKEIAPPRPPGKPRKDGATPTRRRTARSR